MGEPEGQGGVKGSAGCGVCPIGVHLLDAHPCRDRSPNTSRWEPPEDFVPAEEDLERATTPLTAQPPCTVSPLRKVACSLTSKDSGEGAAAERAVAATLVV